MKPKTPKPLPGKPASELIDQRIRDLGGWRGETLARMRALILEAEPEMTEKVDARAFKALVKAAVAQNGPPAKKR